MLFALTRFASTGKPVACSQIQRKNDSELAGQLPARGGDDFFRGLIQRTYRSRRWACYGNCAIFAGHVADLGRLRTVVLCFTFFRTT
ncbi:MAG: hypothetical protein CMJ81_04600 [Planctomycetaceae bacterium]|nr:hypothetical protein [Planctomycetaceae bacterium]